METYINIYKPTEEAEDPEIEVPEFLIYPTFLSNILLELKMLEPGHKNNKKVA